MSGSESKRESSEQSWGSSARKAVCVAGTVAAGVALLRGLSSDGAVQNDEEDRNKSSKLMKAPGRKGEQIERKEFEEAPKAYFRDLRGKDK